MIRDAKMLVVKVGSSLVTNEGRGLDAGAIGRWAAQVAQLNRLGKKTVLVSSGAIAEGMQRLGGPGQRRAGGGWGTGGGVAGEGCGAGGA